MLNKYAFLLFLCMSQWSFFAKAQIVDPLEFFPHHEGDIWEYYEFDIGVIIDTVQNVITKDSLSPDGNYYIHTSSFGDFVLDTLNNTIYMLSSSSALIYKLDADLGNSWVVQPEFEGYMHAKVIDLYSDVIFNQPTIIKTISYHYINTTINANYRLK